MTNKLNKKSSKQRITRNRVLIIILIQFLFLSCSNNSKLLPPPEGLLCELLRYPEKAAITDDKPEFGWIFPSEGISQTAFRILVASSEEKLNGDEGNIWDSEIVYSYESINVEYSGKSLLPNSSYWWKVKIWDSKNRESDYSISQKFNTSNFTRDNDRWPGDSKFVSLVDSTWVSENRQTAEFQKIKPNEIKRVNSNKWFTDFNKAAFSTLELSINSPRSNDTLDIYLGEQLDSAFSIRKDVGVSNIGFYKSKIILEKGIHKYQYFIPKHDSEAPNAQELAPFYPEVLPFRYVEIYSKNDDVEILELEQQALFYPFDDNASNFKSSDSNLNKVWDLCKYTLKATPFLGIYADGNRERMPYEADSYIQQLGHYSVDREYSIGRNTTNFLLYNASWPTEWNMQMILMAWQDYMHTGNLEFLKKYYIQLKNKTLLSLAGEDGLISTRTGKMTEEFLRSINYDGKSLNDIVDWPKGTPEGQEQYRNAGPTTAGERDNYEFMDYNTVVNSFHYYSLKLMAKISKVLENNDEQFFLDQANKVQKSFIEKFLNQKKNIFIDGIGSQHSSLHANMFPLVFGLVPEENIESVTNFIKKKGMACSVYGSQFLLESLFDVGEADYAISLITSDSKRSWLNMISVGSTMTTEAWDEYYKPNLTWNHAWGAAPANIIPRKLMGIEPTKPGFKEFRIVPQPGQLEFINLKIPSIRGTIECKLKASSSKWEMNIMVPGNSKAELYLPAELDSIKDNLEICRNIKSQKVAGNLKNMITLRSGYHTITAENIK